jgi:hypothetical protein
VFRATKDSWVVLTADDSKMPVSALNALPDLIASPLPVGRLRNSLSQLSTASVVTIVAFMLLGYLCLQWSRQVYGFAAGILSRFLFAFEPNTIVHSQLVTTKLYAAITITLTLYVCWRYSLAKNLRHAAALGLAVGLSQLAKYSGLFLLGLLPMALLLADSKQIMHMVRVKDFKACRAYGLQFLGHACLVALIIGLVINAGYLFNRTLTPLKDYHFQSDLFQSIQSILTPLRFISMPLPYPYLDGLDLVCFQERTGFGYGRVYLLGHLTQMGFVGYYLIAFLFKRPIALQLIYLLVILSHVRQWTRCCFEMAEFFILIPIPCISIYFNLFYQAQIWIRLLLIISHVYWCSAEAWSRIGAYSTEPKKYEFSYLAVTSWYPSSAAFLIIFLISMNLFMTADTPIKFWLIQISIGDRAITI